MSTFIKIGNRVYNSDQIHSITLNNDGQKGWMRIIDSTKRDGYDKIALTPEEYEDIAEKCLGVAVEKDKKPTRIKKLLPKNYEDDIF